MSADQLGNNSEFLGKMPVIRRERHRSTSSSPKLPSRTLSPRNASASTSSSGHRFLPDTATISKAHGSGRSSSQAHRTASYAVNNAPDSPVSNSGSNSPSILSSSAAVLPGASSVTPLGMSLRNHSRNILGESLRHDGANTPRQRNNNLEFLITEESASNDGKKFEKFSLSIEESG